MLRRPFASADLLMANTRAAAPGPLETRFGASASCAAAYAAAPGSAAQAGQVGHVAVVPHPRARPGLVLEVAIEEGERDLLHDSQLRFLVGVRAQMRRAQQRQQELSALAQKFADVSGSGGLGGGSLELVGEAVEVGAGELPFERLGDVLVASTELE